MSDRESLTWINEAWAIRCVPKPGLSRPSIRGCSDEKRKLSPRWPERQYTVNPIQAEMWKPAIAAIRLMILTEWRRGEVLGLRWSEVDLSRRTARLADTKTGASLRPLSAAACAVINAQPKNGDVVFASRSDEVIVGYPKMWSRIAKLGDPPGDITPHTLRRSFASLAADLGYNEPTIATLLGHKTHNITNRYVHSADAVLLAAADVVANVTMKLMGDGFTLVMDITVPPDQDGPWTLGHGTPSPHQTRTGMDTTIDEEATS